MFIWAQNYLSDLLFSFYLYTSDSQSPLMVHVMSIKYSFTINGTFLELKNLILSIFLVIKWTIFDNIDIVIYTVLQTNEQFSVLTLQTVSGGSLTEGWQM